MGHLKLIEGLPPEKKKGVERVEKKMVCVNDKVPGRDFCMNDHWFLNDGLVFFSLVAGCFFVCLFVLEPRVTYVMCSFSFQ